MYPSTMQIVTPWNVTRRMLRMNDKLDKLIGQKVAEKIGKGWGTNNIPKTSMGVNKRRTCPKHWESPKLS